MKQTISRFAWLGRIALRGNAARRLALARARRPVEIHLIA
jgi:hypothetical protein